MYGVFSNPLYIVAATAVSTSSVLAPPSDTEPQRLEENGDTVNIAPFQYNGGCAVAFSPPGAEDAVLANFLPKTELVRKLLALRRAYVEKGGALFDADALAQERLNRRGGLPEHA